MNRFLKIHSTNRGEQRRKDLHYLKRICPPYFHTDWNEWSEPIQL
ncbi:MAG TPA: hypothetical protein PKW08_03775 [Flavobacteriaceae bacterium]|nr:hypothetical protein [Flavobacteriaceae bacterium]HQU20684.1 hypothetical protein [Flavobacteriaceae bacterium]HQU64898.1 hypothetical protein [Flavobacteriaceae bacterium]HRW43906.1 hypothetical protein [Flavobacteriaceae bacterium]